MDAELQQQVVDRLARYSAWQPQADMQTMPTTTCGSVWLYGRRQCFDATPAVHHHHYLRYWQFTLLTDWLKWHLRHIHCTPFRRSVLATRDAGWPQRVHCTSLWISRHLATHCRQAGVSLITPKTVPRRHLSAAICAGAAITSWAGTMVFRACGRPAVSATTHAVIT